jgi:hypothetical protein
MVPLSHLWLAIVLSGVLVFIVSAILHMVLKYHNSDYQGFSNEDEVRAAISKGSPAPGQYMVPYCPNPQDMKKPELARKFTEGPVGMVLLRRPGPMNMGPSLGQWFVYTIIMSALIAYVAARTLAPGAAYADVFRVVGAVGFLGYAGAYGAFAIWMGMPWSSAIKNIIDGLIYGMVTAGAFGWLWPKA